MTKTKQPGEKSILDMTPQELLRMFMGQVDAVVTARNETIKTILMAEIKDLKQGQTRIEQRVEGLEQGQTRIEQKLGTKLEGYENRISHLEQDAEFPRSH